MKLANQISKFCIIFILSFLLTSCSPRQDKCPIGTLVLDGSLFPEGTFIGQLQLEIPEMPKESAYRDFSRGSNDVINYVVNWKSERAAKREFDDRQDSAFAVNKYMGPWETPNDLYKSSIADNYRAACGMVDKNYQCRLVATYKKYSVYLKAEVADQWVTLSKVNELLQAVDKRMVECTQ